VLKFTELHANVVTARVCLRGKATV